MTTRLKAFGFAFDRQAAGSHEIWYNAQADRYTTIPNHPATCQRALFVRFSNRPVSRLTIS
ncbi:MAG: type II toxin-antitoxin system HicA family toxin [Desulfofustis sp. PB-SRB1]|nr:type II toxin-antitoxin system HicA family toxin [Desulfofustis sp. PB-SRB1]